jgi:hypothetical protein
VNLKTRYSGNANKTERSLDYSYINDRVKEFSTLVSLLDFLLFFRNYLQYLLQTCVVNMDRCHFELNEFITVQKSSFCIAGPLYCDLFNLSILHSAYYKQVHATSYRAEHKRVYTQPVLFALLAGWGDEADPLYRF